MRSLAVLAFIALVAGAAVYVARRPTVAHGDVLAADLLAANGRVLRTLECDPEVPIGVDGATFWCRAHFKLGAEKRLEFKIDRAGQIKQIDEAAIAQQQHIDPADPWR